MAIEKILVVDDELLVRSFLKDTLMRKSYDVMIAENGMTALKLLKTHHFDLVLTDMRMPDLTGMDIIKKTKEISPSTIVIVITAFGSIENAVEAMRLGAFNYLIKPFSPDTIETVIEKADEYTSLINENKYLRQKSFQNPASSIIAESPAMQKIMHDVKQMAKSGSSVLIEGESGTGKEVIAHAIHYSSPRASKPFIKVNCAAIPETLIESEFFGHEKGAFTGASEKRLGRFELANKGTLLLDEITEVPLTLQPKLLRAIQEQEFERVGGAKSLKVDLRFISTTNRNIKHALKTKMLREDLFYRLNVFLIHIPPLRERREDIIPLANHFLKQFCEENHTELKYFSDSAKQILINHSWRGNARQLSNTIERAVVMETGLEIKAEHLFTHSLRSDEPDSSMITVPVGLTLQELEKKLIIETLLANKNNRTKTAQALGISIRTLRNKLHEYKDNENNT